MKHKITVVSEVEVSAMWEKKYTFMYDLGCENDGEDPSTEAATLKELVCALRSGEVVKVYKDTLATRLIANIRYQR